MRLVHRLADILAFERRCIRSGVVALLHHTQRYASVARLAGAAHRRSRCSSNSRGGTLALACSAAALFAFLVPPALGQIVLPGFGGARAPGSPGIVLGGPVTLNADNLAYDEDTGVALAEGNVEVGFGNRTIRADRIRFDSRTGDAELTGKVRYKDAGDEFAFDRIDLNFETELGVLYNGSIRLSANNYLISSERFEKIGSRTFRIRKASLTTCPCDPEPDWKFEVRRSQVTIDGYAVGKDVTFRIRGVPVLWLPWAAFPVKLTRQSGLLMPSFGRSGSKGYFFQLPYYWAINGWSDATITVEAMSRRGIRPEAEYRYVLKPDSEGEARASFYRDEETGRDRYRLYGSNRYHGGGRWTSNAQWDLASDDRYYVDLVDADILRTARHVPSRGFAGNEGADRSSALAAVWVKDVQQTPDDNTVQRLPEFSGTALPRSFWKTRFDVTGEAGATYFHREAGNRELRARGSGELSRTFVLYPSVTATPFLWLDVLGSYPAADRDAAREGGRIVPGGGVRLEAEASRSFEREKGTRLLHSVHPAVGFRWIPAVDQSDIPVTDLWSRVGAQEQFTFSLTQRLFRVGAGAGFNELASLVLEWALDAGGGKQTDSPYVDPMSPYVRTLKDQVDLAAGRVAERRDASSDLYSRLLVRPKERWSLSGEMLFGTETRKFTLASLGGEWKKSMDNRVLAEYRISRDLSEDVHALLAVRPVRILGLQTNVNYSIRNGELTDGSATLTAYPRSDCWSVGLVGTRRTRPEETSYKLVFSLKGIGTIGN